MKQFVRQWVSRDGDNAVRISASHLALVSLICEVFGPRAVPKCTAYLVEYRIDPRGKYFAYGHAIEQVRKRSDSRDKFMPYRIVCFIPDDWGGQRVARKVVQVEK